MIRWSWAATGFAMIAAVIQPFTPLWLFMAFILASLLLSLIGLLIAQRRWNRILLIEKMDKAFGVRK